MTTAVVATSTSALHRDYDQRAAEIAIESEQNQDIIIEDEEIESVEAEEDAAMVREEEHLMREGLIVKEDDDSDRKVVERDMLTTALVNSVVQTRGAASEQIQLTAGVANPLAAEPELPSPESKSSGAAAASAPTPATPIRRSRRRAADASKSASRDDKSRSPVMTRRRTGRQPTLSSKAKAAAEIQEFKPYSPRSQRKHSSRSSGRAVAAASVTSSRKSSGGGDKQGTLALTTKSSIPNGMAGAASLVGGPQQPHHQQTMPPPPVMTMQLPSNPSSVAPSPLLSGASGGRARIFSIDLDGEYSSSNSRPFHGPSLCHKFLATFFIVNF